MNDWLKTYGWKFAIALVIAAIALAYIVHAERKAKGLALMRPPQVVLVATHGLLPERLPA